MRTIFLVGAAILLVSTVVACGGGGNGQQGMGAGQEVKQTNAQTMKKAAPD
jgi:hypothetical protein